MIIGISGKKQHGKSTVGSIIQYLTRKKHLDSKINNAIYEEYLKLVDSQGNYSSITATGGMFSRPQFETKQFAGKLKQIVALLIGCSVEQLENEKFKNTPLGDEWNYNKIQPEHGFGSKLIDWNKKLTPQYHTPRSLLQLIGTEGLRNIVHPNVHLNALFVDYVPKLEYPNWIITDVRFPNEVEAIHKREGLVIRVENNRITNSDTHASETALDDYGHWNWKIYNDGTIDQLVYKVQDFLQHHNII